MIAVYMKGTGRPYVMALIPGTFYMYIVSCYILNAQIGLRLPLNISYVLAGVMALVYAILLIRYRKGE